MSLGLANGPEHPADWRVRESGRAKRMSINVTPHKGVEVVVPRHTSAQRVVDFVEENRAWIDQAREALIGKYGPAMDICLPQSISFPAMNLHWAVQYQHTDQDSIRLLEREQNLTLCGPRQCPSPHADAPPSHDGPSAEEIDSNYRARLKRWLAFKGHALMGPMLAQLAHEHGFGFSRLQVRGQRTRWGSCSTRGTISLNYALLFLPLPLVRYVMLHELCHTRYMSHGPKFWALLSRLEPQGRDLDAQLDEAWRDIPGWVSA